MIIVDKAYPTIPTNETQRLEELYRLGILDTVAEAEFDNLTKLAAQICGTPISLVSLVDMDRQWFKSKVGLSDSEAPREDSFCAHAINTPDDIFIIPDLREDHRFANNPFVTGSPNVVFYAGVPLVTENGNALGSFCVIDHEPRVLNPGQIESLRALANQVVRLFELRNANTALVKAQQELQQKNIELEKFAYTVSHDIKSPLANIETIASILTEDYSTKLGDDGLTLIKYLGTSSNKAKSLVDGILLYHTTHKILDRDKEKINLFTALNSIAEFINFKENIRFSFPADGVEINTNRIALDQVFINLTNNAIKYNDKEVIKIDYGFKEDSTHYHFSVKDNGMGIPADKLPTIFNLFTTIGNTDRYGSKGSGIGLSTVKKLVERLGGQISVASTLGAGTEFTFSLSKL